MRTKATPKRKPKKKRIGASLLAAFLSLFLTAAAASAADKAPDKKDSKKTAPFALVAGTVFRDPGFALPGAEVVLERVGGKPEKRKAVSDARGEFAFRVPPDPAEYRIVVSAKGFQSETKQVSVSGEQRFDATFNLRPESK